MEVTAAPPHAQTSDYTVSVRVVQQLVAAVDRAGVPAHEFLAAVRLSAEALESPEARVTRSEVEAYCELALDLTQDPAFGLHWGEWITSNTFALVAQLLVHAPTLRQAFVLLFKFGDLVSDRLNLELVERDDEAELRLIGTDGAPLRIERMTAELAMLGFHLMLRDYCPSANIRRVNFAYATPDYRAEYTRLFEAAERFDQPFTGIVFDRALLDVQSPHRDDDVQSSLRALAERRMSVLRRRASYALRVRDFLLQHGVPHRVAMSAVAERLQLSLRSLHRRLADEGQSYTSIANEASALVAKRLLGEEQRTIQETAFAMGFDNVSSFHRAFKRWTGTTPTRFRSRP